MPHVLQDPGSAPARTQLELLNDANTVLFSATLMQPREGSYGLNLEGFKSAGVEGQGVKGDGTIIIGEHSFSVLVEPSSGLPVMRKLILDAFKSMTKLRIGTRTQRAKGLRIESEVPVGLTGYRLGLAFAPLEATSTDGVTEGIGL